MRAQIILIVEDNELFRVTASEMFKGLNYHVLTACDGIEALQILGKLICPPVLIISDVEMPNMGGVDFFRSIKSTALLSKIPFVFCSGSVEDVRKDAEELNAEGYVNKARYCEDLIPLAEKLISAIDPARP